MPKNNMATYWKDVLQAPIQSITFHSYVHKYARLVLFHLLLTFLALTSIIKNPALLYALCIKHIHLVMYIYIHAVCVNGFFTSDFKKIWCLFNANSITALRF